MHDLQRGEIPNENPMKSPREKREENIQSVLTKHFTYYIGPAIVIAYALRAGKIIRYAHSAAYSRLT